MLRSTQGASGPLLEIRTAKRLLLPCRIFTLSRKQARVAEGRVRALFRYEPPHPNPRRAPSPASGRGN